MNFNTAFDLLMNRLGNRTDPNLRVSMVIEAAHVQQNVLEQDPFKPWFLRGETETLVTVAGSATVNLPADFLDFDPEEHEVYINSADSTLAFPWDRLNRLPANALARKYATYAAAKPQEFAIGQEKQIVLRPVPDAEYTLRVEYYRQASQVPADAAVTNLWLTYASEWFLGELGLIMATQYLQDDTLGQSFAQQAVRGKQRLQHLDTAKREATMFRSMGDD